MKFLSFLSVSLSALAAVPASAVVVTPEQPADTSRVVDVEEVVLVATPKENTLLRRQPLSSSVLDGDALDAHGITGIKGASAYVPNFFMPDYGSRITSAVYIRGIGSRINTPAVGLYVDNMPYADKSAYNFDFLDVERLDVLRGPQGTLYGRNSMGGLVRVFTRNPFDARGTDVSLGYTTRSDARRASFTTYLHPSSQLAFSLGGFYNGQEGFFKNSYTGKNADDADAAGGRLRAVYRPTGALSFDFQVNYEYSDEAACPYYYEGAVPGEEEEYEELVGLISQNRQSRYRRSLLGTGLNTEWKAKKFTLTSVTAYQNLNDRLFMDNDFIEADVFSLTQKQRLNTVSEELTFKSLSGSRWQWVTGAFYQYQQLRTSCPVNFFDGGIDYINSQMSNMPSWMNLSLTDDGFQFDGVFETPVTNVALFHQSTLHDVFVRGLSVTAGLRLDYDHRSLALDAATAADVNYNFTMAMDGMPMTLSQDFSSNPDMSGRLQSDSWQVLPKVAVQYEFGDRRSNVYVTASKGYRSGGYNIQAYSDLAQTRLTGQMIGSVKDYGLQQLETVMNLPAFSMFPEATQASIQSAYETVSSLQEVSPDISTLDYKAETSWNYEAGTHLNLTDALQFDAAVFLMDTRNQQIAHFSSSSLGRTVSNAGKSRSYGAEVSLRAAMADDRLHVAANYGYTHATFRQYDDYTGNRVPYVPEHTANLSAEWTQPFATTAFVRSLTVGADVVGAGRIYWDEANSMSQPFYVTLGAHASVDLPYDITVSVWGKNLTSTHYDTFRYDNMSRRFAQKGAPCHFGVDLKVHF